ncbi:MAG: DUF1800 domain-containing protein [Bacteroidota bacterium]
MKHIFTFLGLFCCCALVAQTIIGGSNYHDVEVTSSNSTGVGSDSATITDQGLSPNLIASSRFLAQASLGADYEAITMVADQGFEAWLDNQFAQPVGLSLKDYVYDLTEEYKDSLIANGESIEDVSPSRSYWRYAWWQYTMTSPDVLRNRTALALSEILVISEVPDLAGEPLGLASYYDLLLQHSLGNYRDLLYDVTLHPCMGIYLTHLRNAKTDREDNRFPDENYAREVKQLFSIGLYELNIDGTQKLDNNGYPIATYDNGDIAEFAKVFTGLNWGDSESFWSGRRVDSSYTIPMKMYNEYHEPGAKFLLNGEFVPNRNPVDGIADINDAVDNLFNHPNVGPFLARRLIQRFVKSNPSPGYIARVATKFNDNGSGVRGDMKAVIRAILMDQEARDCAFIEDVTAGMLREPITRYTQFNRAFNASSDNGRYLNVMNDFKDRTEQRPLSSPSVFNFFQPDYQPIGSVADMGLFAPEFQIANSLSTIGYTNEVHDWTYEEESMQDWRVYSPSPSSGDEVELDLDDEFQLLQSNKVAELLERLNLVLASGQLSETTKTIIADTVKEIPQAQVEERLYMALFLVMVAPDYLILK